MQRSLCFLFLKKSEERRTGCEFSKLRSHCLDYVYFAILPFFSQQESENVPTQNQGHLPARVSDSTYRTSPLLLEAVRNVSNNPLLYRTRS